MKASVKNKVEDARRAISELQKMGYNVGGIAVSEGKELTPDEKEALDIIQSEILNNTPIPDISIENFDSKKHI